jgi:hypothetical protein
MSKSNINIGIADKDRKKIADGLSRVLADKAGDQPTVDHPLREDGGA